MEGIYGCLERIEKKVEALPVEGTSPIVENRTISPEGIAEMCIRDRSANVRKAESIASKVLASMFTISIITVISGLTSVSFSLRIRIPCRNLVNPSGTS